MTLPRLAHFQRADFLDNCWPDLYETGEHVGFFEPTGQGKSHLAYQLLAVTMDEMPGLRVTGLMPKPKDPATRKWAASLGLRISESYPPPPHVPFFQRKPPGHVIWPRHIKSDVAANRAHLAAVFRKALHDEYWKGNCVILADDVYKLAVMLGLNMELEEYWTAGQSMGAGLWAPNQKPSGTIGGGSVSSFSYNAPAHLFLGHDPDQRNQRRFSEIGGVDPTAVSAIVKNLKITPMMTPQGRKNISDKLYISKRGYMCTIGV